MEIKQSIMQYTIYQIDAKGANLRPIYIEAESDTHARAITSDTKLDPATATAFLCAPNGTPLETLRNYMPFEEAARFVGRHPDTLRHWKQAGKIHAKIEGHKNIYSRSELIDIKRGRAQK